MSDDVKKEHIENGKDVNEAAREKEYDGKEEAQSEVRKQEDNVADDSPTSSGEEERIKPTKGGKRYVEYKIEKGDERDRDMSCGMWKLRDLRWKTRD